MVDTEMDQLLTRIDTARQEKGMTYAQLAEAAGIGETSVTRIFRRETANPGYLTISGMLKAVGLSHETLSVEMPAPTGDSSADLISTYQYMLAQLRLDYETRLGAAARAARAREAVDRRIIHFLRGTTIIFGIFLMAYLMYDILNGNIGIFRY